MPELTDNINLFQPTGFKVNIDRKNYPNLEFFAQSVQHPGVSMTPAEVSYPRVRSIPYPGDGLSFGELSVILLLDEDLNSYIEIYNWMIRMVKEPYVSGEKALMEDKLASVTDVTVTALTSHNNPNKKIVYKDAMPTQLGDIEFQAANASVDYLTVPISFRYSYFEIK